MKTRLISLAVALGCLLLWSCTDDVVINQNQDISQGIWHVDSLASFTFEIPDSTNQYNISYHVRNAVNYPFYNLYVTYYLEDSAANILDSKLQELILFDKKSGQPLGEGMGDLFDNEILVFKNKKFDYSGTYTFKIKQFMRMEELPGIMSFGLKVQQTEL
ncbi:hypothetical protein BFP72_15960 [Reichenbachiella sp. 5M10]|uniref:gliding motility lipoprotein GldH n=1 Tax=Reichenbachiella sp. 5M10 TaxID=1889772 RepID=UPI000C156E8D|nr:gliding motility lipoprotein GldH [Reichenbachiella sp. 5M10]PIB36789.1 hypothetical protein BFP72_15960 [Reichenbachiella sp. 5M10]